jgi:hypothetical protein
VLVPQKIVEFLALLPPKQVIFLLQHCMCQRTLRFFFESRILPGAFLQYMNTGNGQLEIMTETHHIWIVAWIMHASAELIENKTREIHWAENGMRKIYEGIAYCYETQDIIRILTVMLKL